MLGLHPSTSLGVPRARVEGQNKTRPTKYRGEAFLTPVPDPATTG